MGSSCRLHALLESIEGRVDELRQRLQNGGEWEELREALVRGVQEVLDMGVEEVLDIEVQEELDIGEQDELVVDEAARPLTVVYQVGTQG